MVRHKMFDHHFWLYFSIAVALGIFVGAIILGLIIWRCKKKHKKIPSVEEGTMQTTSNMKDTLPQENSAKSQKQRNSSKHLKSEKQRKSEKQSKSEKQINFKKQAKSENLSVSVKVKQPKMPMSDVGPQRQYRQKDEKMDKKARYNDNRTQEEESDRLEMFKTVDND